MKSKILLLAITVLLIQSCKINVKTVEKNEHWYNKVSEFENNKDEIKDNCIIFIGNSITEGFDLDTFFPDQNVVNRGISADHIDGLIDRLDICMGNAKNVKVFVMIGINDIRAGRSEEGIKYLYKELVKLTDKNYSTYEVYLHSILPTSEKCNNCPPELIKNINAYIKRLSEKYDMHYVDIYPLFLKENSDYVNSKLMKDGLHPNNSGYKIWADEIENFIY